ncbi:hypothetical protein B4098_2030 [Heyndrickxia coagulans]|uniref:Uncharacterized protein n=1 Tax=Heyndrickxia coagulans TaxID=1398 RepID=A0A150JVY0_HEYCO|nr:hypothetical protein B4098_2030 [Heyndrickxia coagulans]
MCKGNKGLVSPGADLQDFRKPAGLKLFIFPAPWSLLL